MNFIFDVGNVLVSFRQVEFLNTLFNDSNLVNQVCEAIFRSEEWIMLDRGTISESDAEKAWCGRFSEISGYIRETTPKIKDMFVPIEESVNLLCKLKEKGHKLYYLSNFHKEKYEYMLKKYSFFSLFEGGVFSCDVKLLKPEREIYLFLLEKYSLVAEECVFADDMAENVTAAEELGINGIVFTSVQDIIDFCERKNIEI